MAHHQSNGGGFGNAHPVSFDPIPEQKEEQKEEEDLNLEEALTSL